MFVLAGKGLYLDSFLYYTVYGILKHYYYFTNPHTPSIFIYTTLSSARQNATGTIFVEDSLER
jgi:hypothetical protein